MQDQTTKQKSRIGEILLEYGLITHEQLAKALDLQARRSRRLGSILEEMGYLDIDTLLSVLSKQLDLPSVNLFEVKVSSETLNMLPYDQVKSLKVLPFKKTDDSVFLAMVDPHNRDAIQNIESAVGRSVKPYVVPHYQLDKAISCFEKEGYGCMNFEGENLMEE